MTKASDLPIQEFYCELGRRVRSPRFAFMNYGFAEPDDDPKNEGGHVVYVAIADVARAVLPDPVGPMSATEPRLP